MWVYTRYISTFSRRIKKVCEEIISKLLKDTANPLSHHVMASPNIFNRTQALAPAQKKPTYDSNSTHLACTCYSKYVDCFFFPNEEGINLTIRKFREIRSGALNKETTTTTMASLT